MSSIVVPDSTPGTRLRTSRRAMEALPSGKWWMYSSGSEKFNRPDGLIERIGSPHVRLHLDVKAMCSEAASIPEIIHASARHLEHFHANDENLQGPGFGAIDFLPIFRALDDIRYAGWVSVEVFDYALGPERLARDSIDFMRRIETELE